MSDLKSIRRALIGGAVGAMALPAVALAADTTRPATSNTDQSGNGAATASSQGRVTGDYTRDDMDRDYQAWRDQQLERLDREYATWSSERWDRMGRQEQTMPPASRETPDQSGAGMTTGSPAGRVTGEGGRTTTGNQ